MSDEAAGAVRRTPRPAQEPDVDELVNQTQMLGFGVERGVATLSLKPPHEIVLAWVDAARAMLGDAPNYSETRIDFPTEKAEMEVSAAGQYDRFVFTVQRAGKLTPHEARQKAEAERDALSLMLRAMARKLVTYRRWADGDVPTVHRLRRELAEVTQERNTWESEYERVCDVKLTELADALAERDALQARLDEIRTVLAEDAATRARFQVDTSTSYGPRFLSRIRAIVERAALQGDQPAAPPDVIEVHGELLDGRRIVGTVDLRPARKLAASLAAEAEPGAFPYRQHPHPLCGSNVERQQVGDPGHCEDCCSVGHVVAHPDLGCGDVGCYRTHGDEEPTGEVPRG